MIGKGGANINRLREQVRVLYCFFISSYHIYLFKACTTALVFRYDHMENYTLTVLPADDKFEVLHRPSAVFDVDGGGRVSRLRLFLPLHA